MLFDERATFDSMLAESWKGTARARDAGKRLVKLLRDAEQAHVPWAAAELEALLIDGAMARCKTFKHDGKRVETVDGAKVKTTGGTISRDPVTGELMYEQLAFADMERAQIQHHRRTLAKTILTEAATVAALDRLLEKLDQVPEATTPREACAQLGTTVERVMAGEVSA